MANRYTNDPTRNAAARTTHDPTAAPQQLYTATGDMAVTSTFSGTAQHVFTASGTLAVTSSFEGTAQQLCTASGDIAVSSALSGTAQQAYTLSGDLAVTSTFGGTSAESDAITGTGAVAFESAIEATGTFEAAAPAASGGVSWYTRGSVPRIRTHQRRTGRQYTCSGGICAPVLEISGTATVAPPKRVMKPAKRIVPKPVTGSGSVAWASACQGMGEVDNSFPEQLQEEDDLMLVLA
jgi:hypothetical protein